MSDRGFITLCKRFSETLNFTQQISFQNSLCVWSDSADSPLYSCKERLESLKEIAGQIESAMEQEDFIRLLIIAVGGQFWEMEEDSSEPTYNIQSALTLKYYEEDNDLNGQWEARVLLRFFTLLPRQKMWTTHHVTGTPETSAEELTRIREYGLDIEKCDIDTDEKRAAHFVHDGFYRMENDHNIPGPEREGLVCYRIKGQTGAIVKFLSDSNPDNSLMDLTVIEELRLSGGGKY
jgi:hypothetical protein